MCVCACVHVVCVRCVRVRACVHVVCVRCICVCVCACGMCEVCVYMCVVCVKCVCVCVYARNVSFINKGPCSEDILTTCLLTNHCTILTLASPAENNISLTVLGSIPDT